MTDVSTTSVSIVWDASTDDVGVTGYGVYRDDEFVGSTASPGHTLTGLACGKSYSVAIDAVDAAGNRSQRSSPLTVATNACPDLEAPSAPTNVHLLSATAASVSVRWNASTDNVGVSGYGVFLNGVFAATTTSLSYTFESLACGTSYAVGVEAYDAAGNVSSRSSLTVATSGCPDVEAPSAPEALRIVSVSIGSVSVAWNPSSDNVGVTGYGVYRDGVLVATTTSLSYTLESLECGRSYAIGVEAYDAAGNVSSPASLTAATTQCPDLDAPSVPEALRVVNATASDVSVAWDPSIDNVGVLGYRVYRDGVFVASTSLLTYTFGSLECGSGYAFAVDAYDLAGNASGRAELTASTAPCPESDAVIAVAGDIAGSGSGDSATAALLDALQPAAVLTAGDNAYPDGSTLDYTLYYEPTWGRFKSSTYPTPGNHEYLTAGAAGYFGYFGARAGELGKGYYSYDIGGWHLIALNSEVAHGATSEQVTWLKNDLAATRAQCVLAYWHKPRFTAGNYSDNVGFQPFWDALYAAGAEVVINGHDHNYQRYAPLTPTGARDDARGIREFVVGTGGRSHYGLRADSRREAADSTSYGVLKLALRSDGYTWEFLPEAGRTFSDSGASSCH